MAKASSIALYTVGDLTLGQYNLENSRMLFPKGQEIHVTGQATLRRNPLAKYTRDIRTGIHLGWKNTLK